MFWYNLGFTPERIKQLRDIVHEMQIMEGRLQQARRLVILIGTDRFGSPEAATVDAIQAITEIERFDFIVGRFRKATSWQELLAIPRPST